MLQISGGPRAHLVSIEKEYENGVVAELMADANDGVLVRYWLGMRKEGPSTHAQTFRVNV